MVANGSTQNELKWKSHRNIFQGPYHHASLVSRYASVIAIQRCSVFSMTVGIKSEPTCQSTLSMVAWEIIDTTTTIAELLHKSLNHLNLRLNPHGEHPNLLINLTIPQMDTYGHSMYYGFETTEGLVEYTKAEYRRHCYVPDLPCSNVLLLCRSTTL